MSKHTSGPWEAYTRSMGSVVTVDGPDGMSVARMVGLDEQTNQANARLIAAAPSLLDALEFVMTAHGEQLTTAFEQAQDAIEAAKGVKG